MLYNAIIRRTLPKDFSAEALDVQGSSTGVMKTIQSASWDLNVEVFEEEVNRMKLVALPASSLTSVSEDFAKVKVNLMKHWLLNMGWSREKVKWAGAGHARVIFLRPGYLIHGGTLYGPSGWSQTLTGGAGFSEYARKDLMDHEEQIV
jgi:hypothetical protein